MLSTTALTFNEINFLPTFLEIHINISHDMIWYFMRVFCVVGESGSGKTKLVEELVKELNSMGYSVCTLKHTKLKFFDTRGKDTARHLQAGAVMALGIAQDESIAFIKKKKVDEIIEVIPPIDFLIIEGGKRYVCPKVLVGDNKVIKGDYIAKWKIGDSIDKVVEAIMALPADSVQLYVDGNRVKIKPFIQRAIFSILMGFISNLKGIENRGRYLTIKINLKELNSTKSDK